MIGEHADHWKYLRNNRNHEKASNRNELTAHTGYNSYRPLPQATETKAGMIGKNRKSEETMEKQTNTSPGIKNIRNQQKPHQIIGNHKEASETVQKHKKALESV